MNQGTAEFLAVVGVAVRILASVLLLIIFIISISYIDKHGLKSVIDRVWFGEQAQERAALDSIAE